MSRGRPLALSDQQMRLITSAARPLSCGADRSKFLSLVADWLTGRDEISDADVQVAVLKASERLLVQPSALVTVLSWTVLGWAVLLSMVAITRPRRPRRRRGS